MYLVGSARFAWSHVVQVQVRALGEVGGRVDGPEQVERTLDGGGSMPFTRDEPSVC